MYKGRLRLNDAQKSSMLATGVEKHGAEVKFSLFSQQRGAQISALPRSFYRQVFIGTAWSCQWTETKSQSSSTYQVLAIFETHFFREVPFFSLIFLSNQIRTREGWLRSINASTMQLRPLN